MKISVKHLAIACLLCLSACAEVQYTSTPLTPVAAATQPAQRTLAQQAVIQLDTGYERMLRAGSAWRQAGTIAQGDVYRPVGAVFTLEGANIHEAWLVIRGDALAGFYLPAEHAFSPLKSPVPLYFNH
jgi:hypothetical protein